MTIILVCWSTTSSLAYYPHSLSHFNEFAGGGANGPKHLINSNIDWGQDLLFLEHWIAKHSNDEPVFLAFFNYYNPFDLKIEGIRAWPFDIATSSDNPTVPDGYYAISINLLYEYPWSVRGRDGQRYRINNRPLSYLRSTVPAGWAGYSIRIFTADQMRAAYAAPEERLLPHDWSG